MAQLDDKTLYTEQKDPIPFFPKSAENHLNLTTLIFGGSGSGKTTIIEEILYLIKDQVPIILVIAPKTSDKAYRSKLPARCIKEDLTKNQLIKIWERQQNATQIYNTANNLDFLESVYNIVPDKTSFVTIGAIKKKASEIISEIEKSKTLDYGQKKAQKTAIEELQIKRITQIYKDQIRKHRDRLMQLKADLTPEQQIVIEYIDFNPRLALVIDDSSEKFQVWMKYFKKNEVNPFGGIFYKNRWNYLTLIIGAHDDKLIDTEFRKNSRVTVYCNSQAFVTSVSRSGNGFTPKERKDSMRYANRIFGNEEENKKAAIKNHNKMCYIREDPRPFKYMIANLYPNFTLGCAPLRELVDKMPKKDGNLAANPYLSNIFKKGKK